jgi:hypothetical protein
MGDTLWTRGLAALRGFLSGGTAKTTIVDADYVAIYDSAAATIKRVSFLTLKNQTLGDIDGLVYKGVINCSANPNYPAADGGHVYFVSVAGKIGGGSGTVVEAGDMLICNTDDSAAGDQTTVGANWNILQKNIDLGNISITGGSITGVIAGTLAIATASATLTVAQISNILINNTGQTAAGVNVSREFPAGASSNGAVGACVLTETVAKSVTFTPASGETFYLDGSALAADQGITLASAVKGAELYWRCVGNTYFFSSSVGAWGGV